MKKILIISLIAIVYSSCTYFIAPPYTNVSELIKVRKGMTMNKVNEVLGINPYDIYTVQDDGGTILVYNYRIKERKMAVNGNFAKITKSERGQKEGIEFYGEPSRVYILFEEDKVAAMITDHGREDAELLMITNNNLQLIAQEDLVSLSYNNSNQDLLIMKSDGTVSKLEIPKSDDGQSDKSIFIPVRKENKKQVTKQKTEANKKKGSAVTLVLLGAGALVLLLFIL
jgi:hypothetical protein